MKDDYIVIRIDTSIKDKLKKIAKKEVSTVSQIVRKFIVKAVGGAK